MLLKPSGIRFLIVSFLLVAGGYPVAGQVDVTMEVSASLTALAPGQQTSVRMHLVNQGTEVGFSPKFGFTFPTELLELLSWSDATETRCELAGPGVFECESKSIGPGGVTDVTVELAARIEGTARLDWSIVTPGDPTNDSGSVEIVVQTAIGLPVLNTTIRPDAATFTFDMPLGLSIDVSNTGADAVGTKLTLEASPPGEIASTLCSGDPDRLECSLGALNMGASLQIPVVLRTSRSGRVALTARLMGEDVSGAAVSSVLVDTVVTAIALETRQAVILDVPVQNAGGNAVDVYMVGNRIFDDAPRSGSTGFKTVDLPRADAQIEIVSGSSAGLVDPFVSFDVNFRASGSISTQSVHFVTRNAGDSLVGWSSHDVPIQAVDPTRVELSVAHMSAALESLFLNGTGTGLDGLELGFGQTSDYVSVQAANVRLDLSDGQGTGETLELDLTGHEGQALIVTIQSGPAGELVLRAFRTDGSELNGTVVTSRSADAPVSFEFALDVYPNPFAESVHLSFNTPGDDIRVEIFDLRGVRVATVIDMSLPAGRQRMSWSGRTDSGAEAAPGVYVYRITTNSGSTVGKLVKAGMSH